MNGDGTHTPTKEELQSELAPVPAPLEPPEPPVVVGAGPAGLAAAVYGASEGLRRDAALRR